MYVSSSLSEVTPWRVPEGTAVPAPVSRVETGRSVSMTAIYLHSYVRNLWLRFRASGDELGPDFPDSPDLDHADRLSHWRGPGLGGVRGGDQDQRSLQHGPERGQLGLGLYSRDHPTIPAPGGCGGHEPAPHHPGGGGERPFYLPLKHPPDREVHRSVGAVGADQVLIFGPLQTEGLGLGRWFGFGLELDKGHLPVSGLGGSAGQGASFRASHVRGGAVGVADRVGVSVAVEAGRSALGTLGLSGGPDAPRMGVSGGGVGVGVPGMGVASGPSTGPLDIGRSSTRVAPEHVRRPVGSVAQLPTVRDGAQGTQPQADDPQGQAGVPRGVLAYPEVAERWVVRAGRTRGTARGGLKTGGGARVHGDRVGVNVANPGVSGPANRVS